MLVNTRVKAAGRGWEWNTPGQNPQRTKWTCRDWSVLGSADVEEVELDQCHAGQRTRWRRKLVLGRSRIRSRREVSALAGRSAFDDEELL